MTTPLNDVYQLNLFAQTDNGEVLNVFFYERLNDPTAGLTDDLVDLVNSFHTTVIPAIKDIVAGQWLLAHIEALDLFDTAGFADIAYTGETGARGSDDAGSFSAWGFHTNIVERQIRRGQKRFGPISTADLVSLGLPTGAQVTRLNALAVLLGTTLAGIAVTSQHYTPVVVKRVRTGSPGSYVYTLPTTLAAADVSDVAGQWSFVRSTTQNTRKVGRGS